MYKFKSNSKSARCSTYIYTRLVFVAGDLKGTIACTNFKSNLKSAQCGTYPVGVVAGDLKGMIVCTNLNQI